MGNSIWSIIGITTGRSIGISVGSSVVSCINYRV